MNQNDFIIELEKIGICATKDKLDKLEKYYNLIIEYNKLMNLTAITDIDSVYLKHFYDSLTISKIIDLNKYDTLCDLGSGAGFPGIVIKIFYPNLNIVLVDSLNKRVNFLNKVIEELNLEGICAIHDRIENYSTKHKEEFDIVTARAVAPLNVLLELGINLVKKDYYFIAMKGNITSEPDYTNALNILKCKQTGFITFKLPIENSNRCLIKIQKKFSTPKIFPREYNIIKSKPL
ncbi:MAG: 16S rRNA (guanine(527)-N(7))-methyltransferase RsmG [bacterium]|nr:16S rRNA (guanine(527)-N(7))-methyltransferase RsmG [bacterium]